MHLGRSVLARIWLSYSAVLLAAIILVSVFLADIIRDSYFGRLEERLRGEAALVSEIARPYLEGLPGGPGSDSVPLGREASGRARMEGEVRRLSRFIDARITVVLPDGEVLAESDRDPGTMESHASRLEVRTALAGEVGSTVRLSPTLETRMIYVAVPVFRGDGGSAGDSGSGGNGGPNSARGSSGAPRVAPDEFRPEAPVGRGTGADDRVLGVVRLAVPVDSVEQALARMRRAVATIAVIAILASALAGYLLARRLTTPLRELAAIVRGLRPGRWEGLESLGSLPQSVQEIDALRRAFASMAERLRESLRASQAGKAELAAVLESASEGIVAVDERGRIQMFNRAAEALLGVPTEEAIGRPLLEAVRNHSIAEAVTEARSGSSCVREIRLGGPSPRVLEVHAAPIRAETSEKQDTAARKQDAALLGREAASAEQATRGTPVVSADTRGAPRGAVAVLYDVTKLRRLEQVRSDFVLNVSHELRTPLTAVKGLLESLLDGAMQDPETARRFLSLAQRETDRMVALVGDLLDLARLESHNTDIAMGPVSVREAVSEAVDLLQGRVAGKRLKLEQDIPGDLPAVKGNVDLIRQVFVNLLENAIKFTEPEGTVSVRARLSPSPKVPGQWMECRVADTGPGIPQKQLPRIFERFYRTDAARSRDSGGTGLGLSIVKHIVDRHGGTVEAQSELGAGSTFVLLLPVFEKPAVDDAEGKGPVGNGKNGIEPPD
ncbi:MAG: PAS domain-containing protein [Firmicutes bacterium]|nr:PAS domain-containing protein [Bacillota bacterium]